MKSRFKRGVTLIFAVIITIVVSVLVMSIVRIVTSNSKSMVYFNDMQRCHRLAESGLHKTIGLLAIDPKAYLDPAFSTTWHKIPEEDGWYLTEVAPRVFNGVSGYYIVTSAVRSKNDLTGSSKLHSYVRISNVADYFAAVNDNLSISFPVDISEGMVYAAKDLTFSGAIPEPSPGDTLTDPDPSPSPGGGGGGGPSGQTRVLRAEFVRFVNPPLPWDSWIKDRIAITDTDKDGEHQPIKLDYEHLFPQLSQQELGYYKSLAHAGTSNFHEKCVFDQTTDANVGGGDFIVDIYPPGYSGIVFSDDKYYGAGRHTNENRDHVYYCQGDMYVQGRVHGQVLFVAEGNIYINNHLCIASDSDCAAVYPGPVETALPGAGGDNASTAHQAILITKSNVVINNTFFPLNQIPTSVQTQYIQALVMAPNGSFFPKSYNSLIHPWMALDFKGSMILGTMNSAVKFPDVFGGPAPAAANTSPRTYAYMSSLKSKPPPYMPRIADIYHSVEETANLTAPVEVVADTSPTPPEPTPDPSSEPSTEPSNEPSAEPGGSP